MHKVKIHKLFEYLLATVEEEPEAFLGFSNAEAPRLGAFLADLDPNLPLDWNGQSFQGLATLRQAVIARAGLEGACGADDVLITAGAAEANYLALRQLVRPGDKIVTERPGWPQVGVMAAAIGAELVEVGRREEDGWRLPLDELAQAAKGARLIFLTNPNNPMGALMGEDALSDLAAIAEREGAWLLIDEVYAGLEWSGPRPPAIAGLTPRGITTGSVSKALGLQGLRTGWMICQDPSVIREGVILRENSSEIMNIMGEVIAEIALRPARYEAKLKAVRQDAMETLAQLDAFIAANPRLSWQKPEAGLIGLAKLDGMEGDALARALLAPPYKTFLLPGSAYGMPHHIRLGVGGGEAANLTLGLERLAQLLASR